MERPGFLALGAGLLALAWGATASAQIVGKGSRDERALHVVLASTRRDLRLELYAPGHVRGSDRPDRVCLEPCAFRALPGRYFVHVSGPRWSDVHASGRAFTLVEPSRVRVDPPSATLHWIGLGLGLTGPVMLVATFVALAGSSPIGGQRKTTWSRVFPIVALADILVVSPIGWVLFADTRKPDVSVQPIRRK